jgi:hypothetical protein
MTNANSLTDRIMAGLRQEVECFVANLNPSVETLDEAETKSRSFAMACGAVAQQARVACLLEAQRYGAVGPHVATAAGGTAFFERYEERWVLTHLGRLRIRRAYYWDPNNKQGVIPLDERWALDDREPSPALRRSIGMVSAEVPFVRGRRLVEQLSLVNLPEKRLKVTLILKNLRQLRPKRRAGCEAVESLIDYFETNRGRMKYNEYAEQGLTVGSGTVESGIKNVVNQRMKGCGMRWAVVRAENMLHLRAAYLSDIGEGHQLLAA